jgi:hypothetical protein
VANDKVEDKEKMSAGKQNWLVKQAMWSTNRTLDLTDVAATVKDSSKPLCALGVNSSSKGTWTRLADRTFQYNLEDCDLRDFTHAEASKCLSNKHIFFVGDSLTRYQYLSLVHFISNGNWADRKTVYSYDGCHPGEECTWDKFHTRGDPNILREPDFDKRYQLREDGKWKVKYLRESELFKGNELCDCWDGNSTMSSSIEKNIENRYYVLDNLNLRVSFFKKLGTIQMHAHNLISLAPTLLTPKKYDSNAYDQWPYDWFPKNISEAVEGILQKNPQRKEQTAVLLWNDGIWGSESPEIIRDNLERLASIVGADGQVLYKTTTVTHLASHEEAGWKNVDKAAREVVQKLISKWVGSYPGRTAGGSRVGLYDAAQATSDFARLKDKTTTEYTEHYWDAVHYQPWVYNELNKLLLNQICTEKAIQ